MTQLEKNQRLKKDLGLLELTAMGTGAIIGAGIFVAPAAVAELAGPDGLVSWIIGGLAMLVLALFYAELGSLKPITSGFYVYAKETIGDFSAFMSGWGTLLSYATTAPIELFTIMLYLTSFFPSLTSSLTIPIFGSVSSLTPLGITVSLCVLWLLTALNVIGIKYGGAYATATTGLKLAALGSFIIGGVFLIHPSNYGLFLPASSAGSGVLLGVSATVFSYMGFRQPTDVGAEVKNPKRNIPLAVVFSMLLSMVIYVIISSTFVGMANWNYLGTSPGNWSAVPSTFTLAQSASSNGARGLALLITAGIVVSALGTAGIYIATTGRVPFQMADGSALSKVHARFATPYVSMIAVAILQTFLLTFSFGYWAIYFLSAISGVLSYGISGPLPAMIYEKRGLRPAFRVPARQVLAPLGFVVSSLLVYWSSWPYTGYGLGFVGSGIAAYLVVKKLKSQLRAGLGEMMRGAWLLLYVAGLIVLSYIGPSNFGGTNLLPFPLDQLVVASFSLGVYAYAYFVNSKKPSSVF